MKKRVVKISIFLIFFLIFSSLPFWVFRVNADSYNAYNQGTKVFSFPDIVQFLPGGGDWSAYCADSDTVTNFCKSKGYDGFVRYDTKYIGPRLDNDYVLKWQNGSFVQVGGLGCPNVADPTITCFKNQQNVPTPTPVPVPSCPSGTGGSSTCQNPTAVITPNSPSVSSCIFDGSQKFFRLQGFDNRKVKIDINLGAGCGNTSLVVLNNGCGQLYRDDSNNCNKSWENDFYNSPYGSSGYGGYNNNSSSTVVGVIGHTTNTACTFTLSVSSSNISYGGNNNGYGNNYWNNYGNNYGNYNYYPSYSQYNYRPSYSGYNNYPCYYNNCNNYQSNYGYYNSYSNYGYNYYNSNYNYSPCYGGYNCQQYGNYGMNNYNYPSTSNQYYYPGYYGSNNGYSGYGNNRGIYNYINVGSGNNYGRYGY